MDFVLLHIGAGYHSPKHWDRNAELCRAACAAGQQSLRLNSEPLAAVVAVIQVLENSPLTNCGTGSNLCADGRVECDASLMTGSNMRWAGIGCLSGIRNPIAVANHMHWNQGQNQVCGLVAPCLLVGDGAARWALDNKCSQRAELVTESSRKTLLKYKTRVDDAEAVLMQKRKKRMDTVGAVVISRNGETAAGASSGGVYFKVPGRLGQAASYGSGCWAEAGVAVTTSGTGEQLMKTLLAMKTGQDILSAPTEKMPHDVAVDSFTASFLDSKFLSEIAPSKRLAGLIAAYRNPERKRTEFYCAHNTDTMFYAFQSSDMETAECHLSGRGSHTVKVDSHSV